MGINRSNGEKLDIRMIEYELYELEIALKCVKTAIAENKNKRNPTLSIIHNSDLIETFDELRERSNNIINELKSVIDEEHWYQDW